MICLPGPLPGIITGLVRTVWYWINDTQNRRIHCIYFKTTRNNTENIWGYFAQLIFNQGVTRNDEVRIDLVKYPLLPIFGGAYFKMESHPNLNEVNFDTLQSRLIALVNFRISNGEFTVRGLARMLCVSQPQMHNVLKGHRRLQCELADALLRKLSITILDLVNLGGHAHLSNSSYSLSSEQAGIHARSLTRGYPSNFTPTSRKPPSNEITRRPARELAG